MIKVLVVEDNEAIRKAVTTVFLTEGFSVTEASDGEMAIKMVETEKPDVVILDLMIPKISGLDVFKKIRSNKDTLFLPVIVFTNIDTDDAILDAITTLNPKFYVNKSDVNLKDLPERVRSCLES